MFEDIGKESEEEKKLYQSLRAKRWDEFYGQEKVKKSLRIAIEAAKKRGEALEHIMFYGPPGLGKTTLAHIIAEEMNTNIRVTSGPALERAGDLASILTNLEEGEALFIDEIHRLKRVIEETLYPAMEDRRLDVILGKGPGARTVRLDLAPFTIIGATTQIGKISSPLRDRFGVIHRMDFYEDNELADIIKSASKKLEVEIDDTAAKMLAARSRKTARIALKLLKRVRDYSQVSNLSVINKKAVDEALSMLGVDELGLDANDRMVLTVMIEKHAGGPVGLSTLSASIAEDSATIEEVYEPFLMRVGMLKRTPKGRVVTENAYKHLGLKMPNQGQKLF